MYGIRLSLCFSPPWDALAYLPWKRTLFILALFGVGLMCAALSGKGKRKH